MCSAPWPKPICARSNETIARRADGFPGPAEFIDTYSLNTIENIDYTIDRPPLDVSTRVARSADSGMALAGGVVARIGERVVVVRA